MEMLMQNETDAGSGYAAIVVRAGMLSIESYPTYDEAVAHLRRWYAGLINDPISDERPYLITAMRNPYTATLAELQACYSQQDADQFWCDVVPLIQVVARITPTLLQSHG
jgi:hypothetical protein